jgi:hypothetical protein
VAGRMVKARSIAESASLKKVNGTVRTCTGKVLSAMYCAVQHAVAEETMS